MVIKLSYDITPNEPNHEDTLYMDYCLDDDDQSIIFRHGLNGIEFELNEDETEEFFRVIEALVNLRKAESKVGVVPVRRRRS